MTDRALSRPRCPALRRPIVMLLLMMAVGLAPVRGQTEPAPVEDRAIVFMSNRDGDWDIYRMDGAGGALLNLSNSDADDGYASFSADGAQITFLSTRGGGELGPHIMNADGSDQRSLASDVTAVLSVLLSGRGDWDLSYTAGGELALISLRDLNLELYRRDADGDRNLSRSGAIDWFPAWSPDARQIAFASDRAGSQDIYTADDAGGALTRLTDHAANDWFPVWSADGMRLIFVSDREQPFSGGQIGLHVIDIQALESGVIPPAPRLEPEDGLQADLNWAADGEAVVFMAYVDGNWEIFRAGRDDSAPVNLTNSPADDLFPIWMP